MHITCVHIATIAANLDLETWQLFLLNTRRRHRHRQRRRRRWWRYIYTQISQSLGVLSSTCGASTTRSFATVFGAAAGWDCCIPRRVSLHSHPRIALLHCTVIAPPVRVQGNCFLPLALARLMVVVAIDDGSRRSIIHWNCRRKKMRTHCTDTAPGCQANDGYDWSNALSSSVSRSYKKWCTWLGQMLSWRIVILRCWKCSGICWRFGIYCNAVSNSNMVTCNFHV